MSKFDDWDDNIVILPRKKALKCKTLSKDEKDLVDIARKVIRKYDPDQPRDENGRFGEGGGGSGGDSGSDGDGDGDENPGDRLGFSKDQISGMDEYATEIGPELNSNLRDGSATEEQESKARILDADIEASDEISVDVYRGAGDGMVNAMMEQVGITKITDKTIGKLKGMTIEDKGFISTTTDKKTAIEFANGMSEEKQVVFTIAPSGKRGFDMAKTMGSDYDSQSEIVFGRGSKLKIESVFINPIPVSGHQEIRVKARFV